MPARSPIYISDPVVVIGTEEQVPQEFDITLQVKGVQIDPSHTEHDVTTYGNQGHRHKRGLQNGSITLDFYVAFEAQAVGDIFANLYNAGHEYLTFAVYHDDSETTGYTGSFLLHTIPTIQTGPDAPNEQSISFKVDGVVTVIGTGS